ncbi:hypothetical protein E2I00_017716, partial [Balaenoptera physalus]
HGRMTRKTGNGWSLQWKVGALVCCRRTEVQRAAGENKTQRTWWATAGTMQFLAWLMVAICFLPGVTTTQHRAGTRALGCGQPMDSTSVGGGLQEPEAPEVMFEVFPPAWDMGDEELASTRPGRRLSLLLQHHVPSDLEGAEQRLQQFQDLQKGPPLSPWDFEHLLLTGLSCVYRVHETLWDLCKGFCPQGQPPSLGPSASTLDPFP